MNFIQAERYLAGTINESLSRRVPYRLERMRALLKALDDPHVRYPSVHVGGTSGKGSTSTMIAEVLTASGKRTGLHTKPHMRSVVERARIDGADISEEAFAEVLSSMMPAIEHTAAEFGRPSYYETLLALAFVYFARERVDTAVIEVGVGGKLDGTNVLNPVVCAITNIGLDHTEILGDTIEAIAADKAGIAKPGVPLVSAVEQPSAREIIAARCSEVGAPFIPVYERAHVRGRRELSAGQEFTVTTRDASYEISLPLLGEFQERNAATAIVVLEELSPALCPAVDDVERGIARAFLPGRMELFVAFPSVLFDIAHNPDKAQQLARSLRSKFPDRRFSVLLAVDESKDAGQILLALRELPASYIFTSFETQGRIATKPRKLAGIAEGLGLSGRAIEDPIEALSVARRNARSDDIVVVTGSTFVVAQLREWWMGNVVAQESGV
ncbi:MAG: bifunctional folylpolyglutamate synthase/dihydrofolate synthase [Candidatus Eremiobacteraeota bacterium]|nr:bifunctional folylpolyglutamate synthase/dihydrofolate synthase [Candidatus Eremiobacteraeota bacterium]